MCRFCLITPVISWRHNGKANNPEIIQKAGRGKAEKRRMEQLQKTLAEREEKLRSAISIRQLKTVEGDPRISEESAREVGNV